MTILTVNGLRPDGSSVVAYPPIAWAIATGTANAIAGAYTPTVTGLYDGLILGFRALLANTTTTPNFSPDGLTAKTIVKGNNVALAAGDIPGQHAECLVRYNATLDKWELLNPYVTTSGFNATWWVAAGGTADAITGTFSPAVLAVSDGLLLSVRASAANATATPTFSPNGLTARVIKKNGGVALAAGDIVGAGHELLLRYRVSGTPWWELLNPGITAATDLYKVHLADEAKANNTNVQPWFATHGTFNLGSGNVLWKVDGMLYLTRSAGSTSHTTSLGFSTTGVDFLDFRAWCNTGDTNVTSADNSIQFTSGSAQVVKAASTATSEIISIGVTGIIRGTTGTNTINPYFQYSAAPGGAPTAKAGTFFKLTQLNATGEFGSLT